MRSWPSSLLPLAVWGIGGAALGYELALARLLAISLWPALAATLLTLAALGGAVSGTVLSTLRLPENNAPACLCAVNALAFALSVVACASTVAAVIFDPLDLLSGVSGWLPLMLAGAILGLPLFFATNCLVLVMVRFPAGIAGIYAANLIGAGMGGIAMTAALFLLSPGEAMVGVALVGAAVGWLALLAAGERPRWLWSALTLGSLALAVLLVRVDLEPFHGAGKDAARWLGAMGAREAARRDSPLARLQIVRNEQIPPRYAPGLALTSRVALPEQLVVLADGEFRGVIDRAGDPPQRTAYLDRLPSALPYHLLAPRPTVLVLGAGGGSAVRQALQHHAARVDAVEPNPQLSGLVRDDFGPFAGHLFSDPRVALHIADARAFIRGADARWNLIQLPLEQAPAVAVGAVRGLDGDFAYTVDALVDYLQRLEPGGLLAVTGIGRQPPRDGVKLFATALAALERLEVPAPPHRLVWVRSWQVTTLVLKNGEFARDELERIRRFDRERGFDEGYLPRDGAGQADGSQGRPGGAPRPPVLALVGPQRDEFLRNYAYRVEPATDDRPYFFDFFRWPLLSRLQLTRGAGAPTALDMTYPLHLLALCLALIAAVVLAALPLGSLRRQPEQPTRARLFKVAAYFSMIGMGVVLNTLVYLERLTLYLGHRVYAVPVIVAGFLVFAGIGSRLTAHIPRRTARGRALLAAGGLVTCSMLYYQFGEPLLAPSEGLHLAFKLLMVLVVIVPPALCMGLMLPLGMKRLTHDGAQLVPWAFGINRGAAAVAPVLGIVVAMEFGQSTLLLMAAVCYVCAAFAVP